MKIARLLCVAAAIAASTPIALLLSDDAHAADLKVMKVGLGSGTVGSATPGIGCGTDCDETYASAVTVTLTATADPGAIFVGWQGDCTGTTATCNVVMSANRAVRAEFGLPSPVPPLTDVTPSGIAAYLAANSSVNSAARLIAVLPQDFRQNWILMSRSESLQTGTARAPRLLLPSASAANILTVGMVTHASYPGSHPDAIEYMQWDPAEKNFRFHEIVVKDIAAMGDTLPDGTKRFPMRPRGVSVDDAKCSKCHSTRNVHNNSPFPGTSGIPPGSVKVKNKPNWDAYDSWGGMLPFNRDRIYQNSIEATAFRHIFNLWNWRGSAENDSIRQIVELLELQPPHVASTSPHSIARDTNKTSNSDHIRFGFDSLPPLATTASPSIGYSFGGAAVPAATVQQGGRYVTLRHSNPMPDPGTSNDDYTAPSNDEGRGVQLFDLLGGLDGNFNAHRIADEVIEHRFATGSVPIDVRPITLAILNECVSLDSANAITPPLNTAPSPVNLAFFTARNGNLNVAQIRADTMTRWAAATMTMPEVPATRSTTLPRRKADIQKLNLNRSGDRYLLPGMPENGLLQQYDPGSTPDVPRLRQEIFRRPIDLGDPDGTAMGGIYVDREQYTANTNKIALLRYFLEPLGVSVDKWSMGVRGRSRAYNFADVFGAYENIIEPQLIASLGSRPVTGLTDPNDCSQLVNAVKTTLSTLPPINETPKFTDVQRVFNKGCIECHGGLGYRPYGTGSFDLSENENPPATVPSPANPRLARSYENAVSLVSPPDPADPTNAITSYLYQRIVEGNESCPGGIMPCGGPVLSQADVDTIRRWIVGPPTAPYTEGDPHIRTVEGVSYDFQSAGEFVLLRDEFLEIQARQTPVPSTGPLAANAYTGLSSCFSVNSAVAVRVGQHRISYQPHISGRPNPEGLQLRIDGKLTPMTGQEIALARGGRIVRTTAPQGIQIEAPGGTVVVITPNWWTEQQLWYMNINTRGVRATEGVMGSIAPQNWLPALPDGGLLGPRPASLSQRYQDLYVKFADAWRVTDDTSLFEYAPGTSTRTFTVAGWPGDAPRSCNPPTAQGRPPLRALQPLTRDAAKRLCGDVVDKERKANCEQDVMVSGHAGFANTYRLTERIERAKPPPVPVLDGPVTNLLSLSRAPNFAWKTAADPSIKYRLCVWVSGDLPTFKDCTPMPTARGRGIRTMSRAVPALRADTDYLWKVIAEDGRGGVRESETRRLTVN